MSTPRRARSVIESPLETSSENNASSIDICGVPFDVQRKQKHNWSVSCLESYLTLKLIKILFKIKPVELKHFFFQFKHAIYQIELPLLSYQFLYFLQL